MEGLRVPGDGGQNKGKKRKKDMNQKQKNPYRALMAIPIAILWNIVLFWLAVFVDTKVLPNPEALGHPVPIFTGFCILGLPVIDLVIVLVVVFITIVRVTKLKRNNG